LLNANLPNLKSEIKMRTENALVRLKMRIKMRMPRGLCIPFTFSALIPYLTVTYKFISPFKHTRESLLNTYKKIPLLRFTNYYIWACP